MPTQSIDLTDNQAQLIEALVQSGRYRDASEVLREGLRIIEHRETDADVKLQELRTAAALGTAALDRGDFVEFSTAAALTDHLDGIAARVRGGGQGD